MDGYYVQPRRLNEETYRGLALNQLDQLVCHRCAFTRGNTSTNKLSVIPAPMSTSLRMHFYFY